MRVEGRDLRPEGEGGGVTATGRKHVPPRLQRSVLVVASLCLLFPVTE